MTGHYLGEFSCSYRPVKHGRPGVRSITIILFLHLTAFAIRLVRHTVSLVQRSIRNPLLMIFMLLYTASRLYVKSPHFLCSANIYFNLAFLSSRKRFALDFSCFSLVIYAQNHHAPYEHAFGQPFCCNANRLRLRLPVLDSNHFGQTYKT